MNKTPGEKSSKTWGQFTIFGLIPVYIHYAERSLWYDSDQATAIFTESRLFYKS